MPVTAVDVQPVEVEQLRQQQRVLVGGALGHGGQAPVVGQTGGFTAVPGPGAAGRVVAGSSANRPTTVSVFPTSMASSTVSPFPGGQIESEVEHGGGVGERPHRDEVGAGGGQRGAMARSTPPGHLDQGRHPVAPGAQGHTLGHLVEATCCRA